MDVRVLRLSILMSIVVIGSLQPAFSSDAYQVIPPPICMNNLGETVVFSSRTSDRGQVAAGMANRDQHGSPVIYRVNYENATPAFQRFIDFHECAHHQVGHVDQPHPPRNSYDHLMNESIADCIAILRVREEANETYEAVIADLVDAMTQIGFPKVSTDSRLSNMKNCYTNYDSSDQFIKQVLDASST
jgi:hypothetical protein